MMRSRNRGVALIVVLVVLTAVTIIGLAAMRSSILNLTMATNAQVGTLLFRNSSAGMSAVEAQIRREGAATVQPGGTVGGVPGVEKVLCVGTDTLLKSGDCYDFVGTNTTDKVLVSASGRGAIAVQAAAMVPTDMTTGGTADVGNSLNNAIENNKMVRVYSTAVMSGLSATPATMGDCLENKPNDDGGKPGTVTITKCLADAGAVFTTTVTEYTLDYPGYASN